MLKSAIARGARGHRARPKCTETNRRDAQESHVFSGVQTRHCTLVGPIRTRNGCERRAAALLARCVPRGTLRCPRPGLLERIAPPPDALFDARAGSRSQGGGARARQRVRLCCRVGRSKCPHGSPSVYTREHSLEDPDAEPRARSSSSRVWERAKSTLSSAAESSDRMDRPPAETAPAFVGRFPPLRGTSPALRAALATRPPPFGYDVASSSRPTRPSRSTHAEKLPKFYDVGAQGLDLRSLLLRVDAARRPGHGRRERPTSPRGRAGARPRPHPLSRAIARDAEVAVGNGCPRARSRKEPFAGTFLASPDLAATHAPADADHAGAITTFSGRPRRGRWKSGTGTCGFRAHALSSIRAAWSYCAGGGRAPGARPITADGGRASCVRVELAFHERARLYSSVARRRRNCPTDAVRVPLRVVLGGALAQRDRDVD